jgi:DNA-binding GntR family transcriptional regulator
MEPSMSSQQLLDPKIISRGTERARLSDVAYEAIRDAIACRRIKPGEWLRQEALAQELGMSQLTVREALSRLVAEGLAVHEPYKGVRAVDFDLADLEEIYEMRALLEGRAMELASGQISPEELGQMRNLLPRLATEAGPQSRQEDRDLNREFHWIAIRASRRQPLIQMLEQIWELMNTYIVISQERRAELNGKFRAYEDYHGLLVEALEKGDGPKAREIASNHIHGTLEAFRKRLKAENSE